MRGPLLPVVVIVASAAGAAVLFLFDPATHGFYPVCYLRAVTGLNCPGCGVTRAIHQLLHGNLAEAARLNLLFLLCLPSSAWWTLRRATLWIRGQQPEFIIRPAWLWTFAVVASVFTVIRNLPGFEWLAP